MKKLLTIWLFISSFLIAKDYALLIVISKYKDRKIPRLNITEDIKHYENILRNMDFNGNIYFLKDSDATRDNILKNIQNVSGIIKKEDRFFMFFTGHGTDYKDEDYRLKLKETLPEIYWKDTGMLLPYDFNSNNNKIAQTLIIGKRDLRDYFTHIDTKTSKAFIVFDACFTENSSKGNLRGNNNRFLYIDTKNETYPYKNIVYIGASKTQARSGKLSKVLDQCLNKNTTFFNLKHCLNRVLKKSPHRAIVLSMSDEPMIFREKNIKRR